MSETSDAVAAVVKAWNDPGPHPEWHYKIRDRLRQDWPTLASALSQLAAEVKAQATD